MPKAFLCHSSKDKPAVRLFAQLLTEREIDVWIDEAEIKVGDSLVRKIGEALSETDFVIAFLSENSIDSEWVQKELSIAMTREINERRVHVLPVRLTACDMPGFLKDKKYADFSDSSKFQAEFDQLLLAVGGGNPVSGIPGAGTKQVAARPDLAAFKQAVVKEHDARLERIRNTAGMPVEIIPGPRLVMHLFPYSILDHTSDFDLSDALQRVPHPSFWNQFSKVGPTFDGLLALGNIIEQGCYGSYLQLDRRGIVEYVDASLLQWKSDKIIPSRGLDESALDFGRDHVTLLERISQITCTS